MNIYLIQRIDPCYFDEWSAFIIVAKSAEECKRMVEVGPIKPWVEGDEPADDTIYEGVPGTWGDPTMIGTYSGTRGDAHSVLGSFHAG
jgi:hypothetical protein